MAVNVQIDGDALSDEEIRIIKKHRMEKARQELEHQIMEHILETTRDYYLWLVENFRGSSYSTFHDEYGYADNLPTINGVKPDPLVIYKGVLAIQQYAASQAHEIALHIENHTPASDA